MELHLLMKKIMILITSGEFISGSGGAADFVFIQSNIFFSFLDLIKQFVHLYKLVTFPA